MQSSKKRRWKVKERDEYLCQNLASRLGIPEVIAQILINRGIDTETEAREFLQADISHLHDPFLFKDMDRAVLRMKRAMDRGERITIYGDYDVDGTSAISLMLLVLRELGANVDYHIPHRIQEGYGLNVNAIEEAHARGTKLFITVDCGIRGGREVERANELGVDVIVTDHHETGYSLPPAYAIIDVHQEGCQYPFKYLCGAGVALKLLQALTGRKLEEHWDLVALATVADVVPLLGENRILVKYGLSMIDGTRKKGIAALKEVGGMRGKANSWHLAYVLGPRINATGRIDDADLSVKLLTTESWEEARRIAQILDRRNEERKEIENAILEDALKMIEGSVDLKNDRMIVLESPKWHPGVIGIVASRIVERFHRPVVLIALEDGMGRGSCRSIEGFDIHSALEDCRDLLMKFGGHKQAAGFTIEEDRIPELRGRLLTIAGEMLTEEDMWPEFTIDDELRLDEIDLELIKNINRLEPFGCDNPSPVFATYNASVVEGSVRLLKDSHVKMRVKQEDATLEAIGFRMKDALLNAQAWEHITAGKPIDLVYEPQFNEWNQTVTIQLKLIDVDSGGEAKKVILEGQSEKVRGFVHRLFRRAYRTLRGTAYDGLEFQDTIRTKIAGVTFENRQKSISELREGERLRLVREDNPRDPNAIRVENDRRDHLGYIKRELALKLAPQIDSGVKYEAWVTEVTGGGEKNWGANISLRRIKDQGEESSTFNREEILSELRKKPHEEVEGRVQKAVIGDQKYYPKQKEAMDSLSAGRNTLTILATGGGKSAIFQTFGAIKAIEEGKATIILYPLRALANDQKSILEENLSPLGLTIFKADGSLSYEERALLSDALSKGEVDFILATPEFLEYHIDEFSAIREDVGLLVVDEAHHIGRATDQRRPAYKRISAIREALGEPLTLATTATADGETARKIREALKIESVIVDKKPRSNLHLVDRRNIGDKYAHIVEVCRREEKTVIYTNSREETVRTAFRLRRALPKFAEEDRIAFYHAGLSSTDRMTIESMFKEGKLRVIVSTSAFGEGVNIPDIRHIVHFHPSFSREAFVQSSGRAGRDDDDSWVHLVFGRDDVQRNESILRLTNPTRDDIIAVFRQVRKLARGGEVAASGEALARGISDGGYTISPKATEIALSILEEIGVVEVRRSEGTPIVKIREVEGKRDLSNSTIYQEGAGEWEEFAEFMRFIFDAPREEVLELIRNPITP
ncbi:MAG: single-stranded-DNA-specific exonuclease RecJ [bacterium]